ncbi:MAG: diacylglycerol kinase family protein [Patescibacteria group bacterium]
MARWWRSFKFAWHGLKIMISSERNFRIHLCFALAVILFAGFYGLSRTLWIALLLVIALILALEIFNAAIERLVDMLAPKTHNFAKEIKDLLAGMVLLVAGFAVVIGLIIFWK